MPNLARPNGGSEMARVQQEFDSQGLNVRKQNKEKDNDLQQAGSSYIGQFGEGNPGCE
jgi:hypothetical protein